MFGRRGYFGSTCCDTDLRVVVSRQELGRLKKRFVHLIPSEETSRDLRLPLKVVLQMPELRAQPFVPMVAKIILDQQSAAGTSAQSSVDGESGGELVTFTAFITLLAVFSIKQPLEVKRQGLYRLPVAIYEALLIGLVVLVTMCLK
ncbi:unnamed protein product [Phytophthora fragariaefolia]|uniref:Unnamed protein product n=1 Tax=Phytophthora fragariaefolia TaxID=1490495 RepID=A0A9W6U1I6_9STRA|nr:unnamed protein product [Phytophthora fragariaefolia]